MANENEIHTKFEILKPYLNERLRRITAAAEAKAIGYGGITLVSKATGISRRAIWTANKELLHQSENLKQDSNAFFDHIRKPGGGRKRTVDQDPRLKEDLDSLVDPFTRGDPQSPLRWTCKSVRKLAQELKAMGHKTSHRMVAELLHEMGYTLQANRKTKEGKDHPDRNAQFEYINEQVGKALKDGYPAISVDTKKKELVGDFKNNGQEWRPKGKPEEVRVHDFKIPKLGRVAPYGVYDIANNKGWVSVGTDHDTAEFAVATIRNWWKSMGETLYRGAKHLLITADGGGSNGYRLRLWKVELQKLSDETGMAITVCHFPPGTSKWNKIEHRLFSYITRNWRGRPLVSYETIVNLIASTSTKEGLEVHSKIDTTHYKAGIKVTDEELADVKLKRHQFHGEWNYTVYPK